MPRPRTTSDAQLLAATGRAIGQHGLPGLTLALVGREAGVSPATLIQRFGSKRGLLLALAEQAVPAARRSFARARQAHASPLAALVSAVCGLADVSSREQLANHLTFLHLDLTDARFHAYARAHAQAVREEIATLLAEAVAAGELDAAGELGLAGDPAGGTDPDRLARAVQVTYNGSLITWALTGDGALAETIRTDLETLLTPYRGSKP